MGNLRFNITFSTKGFNVPAEIAALIKDLSEPFQNIINDWAKHNAEKFRRGAGMELSGIEQAADTFWKPLTDSYYKRKHNGKSANWAMDWLMVRTGELMQVMTNPDRFYQYVGKGSAAFGTPLDEENQMKIAGNWLSRQIVFFDVSDKRMIQSHISDYLNYGRDYLMQKRRLSEKISKAKKESVRMDLEYRAVVS